jgi:hypothetical protein
MIAARATNAGSKKSTGSHRSGTAGTNERGRLVTAVSRRGSTSDFMAYRHVVASCQLSEEKNPF